MSFTLSPRKLFSRTSLSLGSVRAEPRTLQIQRGLVQLLFQEQGGFHSVSILPRSSWDGFYTFRKMWPPRWFSFSRDAGALRLLLSQLGGVARALQSHGVAVETEAQREVSVGGPQMRAEQAVGGLHSGNNSEESGSSWLVSTKELSTKTELTGA